MGKPPFLFVGGGSIGHLAPSIAVWQAVKRLMPDAAALFVCANREEECSLLTQEKIMYTTLSAPKFPWGWSWRWVVFPFQFLAAVWQSIGILINPSRSREPAYRTGRHVLPQPGARPPAVIFSKGGYVSAPLCLAGWLKRIPIVLHESDVVTGLSNRLIGRLATKVCLGFLSSSKLEARSSKLVVTGNPVRSAILLGSKAAGQRITGFSGKRPVIMIIGGSQGSRAINEAVDAQFDELLALADVIHLTGSGKGIGRSHARYWSRPFVTQELPHLYALADLVISRAGMGVLSELAALKKAAVVIPLTGIAQEHQWKNAQCLSNAGAIRLLSQKELGALATVVQSLLTDPTKRRLLGEKLREVLPANAAEKIAGILLETIQEYFSIQQRPSVGAGTAKKN